MLPNYSHLSTDLRIVFVFAVNVSLLGQVYGNENFSVFCPILHRSLARVGTLDLNSWNSAALVLNQNRDIQGDAAHKKRKESEHLPLLLPVN